MTEVESVKLRVHNLNCCHHWTRGRAEQAVRDFRMTHKEHFLKWKVVGAAPVSVLHGARGWYRIQFCSALKKGVWAQHERYRKKHLREIRGYRNDITKFLADYKMARGCCDCGYKGHPTALQFDHLRDKKFIVGQAPSIAAAKDEIEKCVVRCANCHAIRHHGQHRKELNDAT